MASIAWSRESNPSPCNQLQEKFLLLQTSPVHQAALQSATQPCPHPVPCTEVRGPLRRPLTCC